MQLLCVGDLFAGGREVARNLKDLEKHGIQVTYSDWAVAESGWEKKLLELE